MGDSVQLFKKIGLSQQKAEETAKNSNLNKTLKYVIEEAEKAGGCPQGSGMLLYHLASKVKTQIQPHLPLLTKYIVSRQLDTTVRIDAALEYLLSNAHGEIKPELLEQACGFGIVVTPEDIELAVENIIKKQKDEILEKRYRFNTGPLLQQVRNVLKWADGKDIKNEVDVQILDLLGPKTDSDLKPPPKKPKTTVEKVVKQVKEEEPSILTINDVMAKLSFHNPGENFKTDGYVITPNTSKLMQEHLKITGGKVHTRFPPEPNGILHIGHAKAININFGYAAFKDGICFLRYDDTNPEKEEEKFFTGIKDIVNWLGYTPYRITHTSDYFEQLYKWAVKLIEKGLAYVCHQKQEEMQGFNPTPSPWRDRPVQENLLLFESMKNGKYEEGQCTLRMKLCLEEGKLDPVAYRIKYLPHHRTGDKWCIYPTYDYAHCLCDSIEHITHSLCTKEFQSRRSSYYWLCNALDIYCPVQWEYGRLNMTYTVVSKRKIGKLIEKGIVSDWDDPRLFTLTALRRRGFPPEAINRFCAQMGVTGANCVVSPEMLESCVRDVLNQSAPRTMVVLDPLRVDITEGFTGDTLYSVPDFPSTPEKSSHSVQFSSTIYIERSDYNMNPEKGYRRLCPGQAVGLKHAGLVLTLKQCKLGPTSTLESIEVKVEKLTNENKPKAFIHWVSKPVQIRVNVYNSLFIHKNPEDTAQCPAGFLSDVSPDSLLEYDSLADQHLSQAQPFTQFQFERLGYFSVDPHRNNDKLTFNRTVPLKEDLGK